MSYDAADQKNEHGEVVALYNGSESAPAPLTLCSAVGVVLALVAADDEDATGDTSAAVDDPVDGESPSSSVLGTC
uniref:Uncharacterized protein n=1 Tax=Oryza rufipogon TaxID=4529 RepID=A0A0E0NMH2_ORYRU